MLRFFSSSNSIVNSRVAIAEGLANALDGEGGTDCDLIVLHATMGHNFKELLEEAKKLAPSAQVVGCTCAGVIGKEGVTESMRALAIMAVKGPKSEFAVAHADNIRGHNSYEVAVAMAKDLKAKNPNVNMALLLASGIDIAADRAIDGIESVFGAKLPIFGGTSSDNMKAKVTYQFVGTTTLERGALIVGFADPTLRVHMRAQHGSVPIGMPLEVTRSEANRVLELDGKPAWPLLLSKLGLPENTPLNETIPVAGLGELLPDSMHAEYHNKHLLRVILKKDEDNKSFYMPVDAPVGLKLWLTRRDEQKIFEGTDQLVKELVDEMKGQIPVAVFHTDCGARGRLMFDRVLKDEIVSRMQVPICKGNNVPWLGMYGFGEFTLLGGRNRFHTYTTSIYTITRKSA